MRLEINMVVLDTKDTAGYYKELFDAEILFDSNNG